MKNPTNLNASKQSWHSAITRGHLMGELSILVAVLVGLTSLTAFGEDASTITIPAGTTLMVKLDKAVTSSDKPGTKFSGVLQGDVSSTGSNSVVAVKSGSAVYGEVTDSDKAKRVRGKAGVTCVLTQVNINGQMVALSTEPVKDVAASSTKKTAKGAAKGAAIGAIADGGDGAARGAAIGAGASALKKGESAGFEAGAVIPFKLAGPLTVTVKP